MWEQSNEMTFPKVTAGPGHGQKSNLCLCLARTAGQSPQACLACRLFPAGPRRAHELCPTVDAPGPLVGGPSPKGHRFPSAHEGQHTQHLPGTSNRREVPGPYHTMENLLGLLSGPRMAPDSCRVRLQEARRAGRQPTQSCEEKKMHRGCTQTAHK